MVATGMAASGKRIKSIVGMYVEPFVSHKICDMVAAITITIIRRTIDVVIASRPRERGGSSASGSGSMA